MDLSIERWEGATSAGREEIARQLARQLPTGFAFESIRDHQLGEHRRSVAIYQFGQASFALITGGVVTLGHDPDRFWEPDPYEMDSWEDSAEEYAFNWTIREHVAQVTTPARRVELAPFLIETAASEPDSGAIDADPDVRTHGDLARWLGASGFRFPTSDEWEYACAGGAATTLFRWGDHAPCDRYPTDIHPLESDWDLHRRPNAFGLFIASNPYKRELVAEIGTTRGGDGGVTICGGAGFFLGWLTLASAYFEDYSCKHDPTKPVDPSFTVGRRVLDLR